MGTFEADRLDPGYVTGLAEGLASFTFSRTSSSTLNLYFSLKRGADDAALLAEVRDFFGGVGRIYAARDESATYRVTRLDDLVVVVGHFDEHPLRGARRASYEVWREMVFLKRKRFRRPQSEELEALARRLSAASGRSRASE